MFQGQAECSQPVFFVYARNAVAVTISSGTLVTFVAMRAQIAQVKQA
jgi:hypothetical protein